jgi:hypothetical protein
MVMAMGTSLFNCSLLGGNNNASIERDFLLKYKFCVGGIGLRD